MVKMPSIRFRNLAQAIALLYLVTPTVDAKTLTLNVKEKRDASRQIRKRQDFTQTTSRLILDDVTSELFVDVNIGSKGQEFELLLTQSAPTWIPIKLSDGDTCDADINNCDAAERSRYLSNPPAGDTFGWWVSPDDTEYRDFTVPDEANGWWGHDDFRIGEIVIPQVNFGAAVNFNYTPPLGLGRRRKGALYETLIERLETTNRIHTQTFGAYMNDIRKESDRSKSITFGGIDVAKFTRPLKTYNTALNEYDVDSISIKGIRIQSQVSSNNINGTSNFFNSTAEQRATLLFTVPHMYFTDAIYDAVSDVLDAFDNPEAGHKYRITKTLPAEDEGLEFVFDDDLTIFMPFIQMLRPIDEGYEILMLADPNSASAASIDLGLPFFRSAYVFFDYTKNEISVARTVYNATGEEVKTVGVQGGSVKDLGYDTVDTATGPGPRPQSEPEPEPGSNSGGGSKLALSAIVGGAVGGVAVIAIGFGIWFYLRRRNQRTKRGYSPPPPPDYPEVYNSGNEAFKYRPQSLSPGPQNFHRPVSELGWSKPPSASPAGIRHHSNERAELGVEEQPNARIPAELA